MEFRPFQLWRDIATSRAVANPAKTDSQAFCYDEQNRLTWASSQSASGPCGARNTAGTLTSAAYTQSFAYDVLDRLTSGPGGSYTYGAWATHLHAVTAIGSAYTASYDAAGDLVCRAPTSGTSCASSPTTGAVFTSDAAGRLAGWADEPQFPTTAASELYDAAGQRVEEQTTQGSIQSTTLFVGGESHPVALYTTSYHRPFTATDAIYGPDGHLLATERTGTFTYLGEDVLGSTTVALSTGGTLSASQLFAPYGTARYSAGTMPTAYGFTGQRTGVTGLEDDGARQYDTSAGQFASADTVDDGLNRYGYVGGNPETDTDPSGHVRCETDDSGHCMSGGGGTGCTGACPTPPSCTSNYSPGGGSSGGSTGNGGSRPCGSKKQCDTDQYNALMTWWASESFVGAAIVLFVGLLRLNVDKTDLAQEYRDALDWLAALQVAVPVIAKVLERVGVGNWVGQVADSISSSITPALSMLNAAWFWVKMWGQWGEAAKWLVRVIGNVLGILEGPVSEVINAGLRLFGSAILYGAAAIGYAMMAEGDKTYAKAMALLDVINHE